jgi:hypothetical protein
MQTPVVLYTASGIPVGPRAFIQFYRPPTTNDANGVPIASIVQFGSESNGTTVGNPIEIEDLTLDVPSQEFSQKGTYGEELNNPTIVRGKPTLNLVGLMTSGGVPTAMPGDYIAINVGQAITSTGVAPVSVPTSRWVADSNSLTTNGVNKFSIKLMLDRPNSSPNLIQF